MSEWQPDPVLLDEDLAGLWVQPGFVEGIVAQPRTFSTLDEVFRHAFRNNREYAVLLWNGVPFQLDYPNDLSSIAADLIGVLQMLQSGARDRGVLLIDCGSVRAKWIVQAELSNMVSVEGFWDWVAGGHQEALNHVGLIRMPVEAFLREWKLLCAQLVQAVQMAEARLIGRAAEQYKQLQTLEQSITGHGRFYSYLSPSA